MSMQYIRDYYKVPAKRGARIRWTGAVNSGYIEGTIIGSTGQYIRVRFDKEPSRTLTLHPMWKVEYLPTTDVRFFCKGCDPELPFWSEHELVKHILEVRGIGHRTAPYTEGEEGRQ